MNKLLLLTAAALAVSVSAADAGKGHATLTVDGSCNSYSFTWKGKHYADTDNYQTCGTSTTIQGMGVARKTKGFGKNVMVNDGGDPVAGYYIDADFQLPFRTGKAVNYYYSTDGVNWTEYLSTTYTVGHAGRIHATGRKSVQDVLREEIAAREGK